MLSHSWCVTTKVVYFYNLKSPVKLIIPKSTKSFLFKEGRKKIAWLLLSFWSLLRKAEEQLPPSSSPSLPPLTAVPLKWALTALELRCSGEGQEHPWGVGAHLSTSLDLLWAMLQCVLGWLKPSLCILSLFLILPMPKTQGCPHLHPWQPLSSAPSLPLGRQVVQLLSRVQLFVTPWTEARQASLSFTISLSLFNLMSIESVMPSNHLILCHPLLLLPSLFPSIGIFSNESALCKRTGQDKLTYWLKNNQVILSSF